MCSPLKDDTEDTEAGVTVAEEDITGDRSPTTRTQQKSGGSWPVTRLYLQHKPASSTGRRARRSNVGVEMGIQSL